MGFLNYGNSALFIPLILALQMNAAPLPPITFKTSAPKSSIPSLPTAPIGIASSNYQDLQKIPTAQDLSDVMRQIKEYGQQLQATPKEQRIAKLIALQEPQNKNMGIPMLELRIAFIASLTPAQLQNALPKKELVDGFLDIMKDIKSAFIQLRLPTGLIQDLKKAAPESPAIKKMQDNIDAFIKFTPTAEQLEKGLDNLATINAPKKSAEGCIQLLEEMESKS